MNEAVKENREVGGVKLPLAIEIFLLVERSTSLMTAAFAKTVNLGWLCLRSGKYANYKRIARVLSLQVRLMQSKQSLQVEKNVITVVIESEQMKGQVDLILIMALHGDQGASLYH
ncbi:hypothetical protein HZH66_010193 [Vespula vulgaris]|uniref:Uncharacterized protein n=1 Tax=Vespula vulgaris TaxID=7454 RepID=A0A834JPB0_VESVU|nr:hypothetical protein HZH66_010193 [Vespula vulgaris]